MYLTSLYMGGALHRNWQLQRNYNSPVVGLGVHLRFKFEGGRVHAALETLIDQPGQGGVGKRM